MNKFKSKKGFTLAELLIVVAIIAVLVAIAVPLFVTALNKADDAVIKANERSVKAIAVTYILSADNTDDKIWTIDEKGEKQPSLDGPWEAIATVTDTGEITLTSVKIKEDGAVTKASTKTEVHIIITATNLDEVNKS